MRVDGRILKLGDEGPRWIVHFRGLRSVLQLQIHDSRRIWQLSKLHVESS
jgi:hypothetical protein